MTLKNELITQSKNILRKELLKKLGYSRVTNNEIERLSNVLADPDFGLSRSAFDFKYSNLEFIESLCVVLNIDVEDYRHEIQSAQRLNAIKSVSFRSYIYVDTGFERSSQSIVSLAVMEGERNIRIPVDVRLLPLDDQLEYVKSYITTHYEKSGGCLPIWGIIKRYIYFYEKDSSCVFSPTGEIIDDTEVTLTKASLCLGNKVISDEFSN